MKKGPKILFTHPWESSFILSDLKILQKHFDVKPLYYSGKKDRVKLLKGMLTTEINISWFALSHAYRSVQLSRIFRKRSVIITGGYDVVHIPEINYGLMGDPKAVKRLRYILKFADKILAISDSIKNDILKHTNMETGKIETVYLGFDYNKFKPKPPKEDLVITVGYVQASTLKRKGLETFVKSAKYLPDTKFVLIGPHFDNTINYLKSIASPNVEFTGFVSDEELLNYYQRAKVYVQVSAHEGFGCSLAEAMLCESVPVITDRGAIPEVVGDTGFYVRYNDPKATADTIKKALGPDKGKEARERVKTLFPLEKREKELITTIQNMYK